MPKPIALTVPLYIRLASLLINIAGYWLCLLVLPQNTVMLGIFLWTWFILRGLFYSPDITIHPHGIETRRLWWRHFTTWNEIAAVRFGELNSQIYPKNIHPLVKYFLYNSLLINAWRENYREAIALMKEQLEDTKSRPQRAYE